MSMVEYLLYSVVPSPSSPELTDLGLWFMLALCVSFVLVVVGSFFGGSFSPAVYQRVSLSPTSCLLLCRCGQVVLELVLPCVQGFEAFLLLLFSCLFLVISSLFICIFR